jgi:signal transduction histidine kinase
LGCSHGIFRVSKTELEELAAGKRRQINPRRFGLNEGMPVEECSSGFCPAGLRTRSGLLCFSTVKGLVLMDPRKQETDLPPPNVLLETVQIGGRNRLLAAESPGDSPDSAGAASADLSALPHLTASAADSDIEFNYTAIRFAAPERLRFRYRLKGLNESWIEAGTRRSATYPSIPAGEYAFQVMVCAANSGWSQPVSLAAITIQPRLWQRGWFQVLAGLTILSLLGAVIRVVERRRYKRRLARLEMLHAVERERLRISQDMHDHVGAMLTQVSMASDLGQTDSHEQPLLKGHFGRIGDQARAAVRALDEIVWATNPKNDNLPRFAEYICRFCDECFEYSAIRCWQEVPTNLPNLPLRADVRHNVFSALKEAFNNVLKHSGATEVSLRLERLDSEVRLTVKDNGRGFVPGTTAVGEDGLGNMRARLAECGGRMELHSAPGQGTIVRLRFPLPGEK